MKAVYLPETIKTADRFVYPQIRSFPDGSFQRPTWNQAMNYLARRYRAIIDEHGADAVVFYGSG